MTGDKDDAAVLRAVIADAPDALLIRELEKRGYVVAERWELPFEWDQDDDGEEALSA